MMTPADRGRHVLEKLRKDRLWDDARNVEGDAAAVPQDLCTKWNKWATEKKGWPSEFKKAEHAMVSEALGVLSRFLRRDVFDTQSKPWLQRVLTDKQNNQKPDLTLVCHWATDEGVPAFGRKLYDLVGGLCDAKMTFSNEAFGELLTHLEWLSDGDPSRVVRGLLWTATEFYLVAWQGSHAIRGTCGSLSAPGSLHQIQTWFAPTSLWEDAILRACADHAVRPLHVLGVGGFARVLEVENADGSKWALKVRVLRGRPDDSRFRQEWAFLYAHKDDGLPLPHAVSELKEAQLSEGARVASFRMQPVGQPISAEAHVRPAYAALRQLHETGIVHGDPRRKTSCAKRTARCGTQRMLRCADVCFAVLVD